jgi:hypothetical protein
LLPAADQSSTSTSEDENDLQHPASPVLQNNAIPAFAMAAQKKFISPPTFSAKPGESAQDCLERFLLTGRYNHWDEAEIRANFVMYLEGTALKWFLFPIYQRTGTTRQRWPQRRTPQQPVCGWITNRLPTVILPRQLRSHPRSKITKTFSKGKERPSNTLL